MLEIMIRDTRQHGCVRQGVAARKVARMDARASILEPAYKPFGLP
jgi:hypothetical protein